MLFAQTNQCLDLFAKEYKTNEFNISITGKKQAAKYLDAAYDNFNITNDFIAANSLLAQISETGTLHLSQEQIKFIIQFRQNTSYLRSVFQTSTLKHKSPKKYAHFVRDFGHLKDMVLINESEKAKSMALHIISKYEHLDFNKLLTDIRPATKKSTKKYFESLIKKTTKIINQDIITVDELHDVRKNMRDILRYLQIQNELQKASQSTQSVSINLAQTESSQDSDQILFLKKTNNQLGKICDDNAALIIQGLLSEKTPVEFPAKIKLRIQHFLEHYRIETTN